MNHLAVTVSRIVLTLAILSGLAGTAVAGSDASPSLYGPLGLNLAPSARMDQSGTIRGGVSAMLPYEHMYVAVQASQSLNIALRQTAEVSNLSASPKALYPGLDLKLRLLEEDHYQPEISLGLISALGRARMAGEYVAMSKRYNAFDITGGLGWGRLGTSGDLSNPANILGSSHFNHRTLDGPMPSGPSDWFAGKKIGLFGGVEYFTPLKGLSVKADWSSDRYTAEESAGDHVPKQPWSFGFNYAPTAYADLGVAVVGGNKIMATFSLKDSLARWFGRHSTPAPPQPVNDHRTSDFSTAKMAFDEARSQNQLLYDIHRNAATVSAKLDVDPDEPVPRQIGRADRAMANYSGLETEQLTVTPNVMGLEAPPVSVMRRDVENAAHGQGSPQEIWRNADLAGQSADALAPAPNIDRFAQSSPSRPLPQFKFILDTQTSLSETDSGLLYRTSGIVDAKYQLSQHGMVGGALRLNGPGDLARLNTIRPPAMFPVRSDVADFAGNRVEIDRLYNGYLRSFMNGTLHAAAAIGFLEEMYAGAGGEILWRPFGKTYAFGAEAWEALRRDPATPLGSGLNGDHVMTGFLKAYYEIPSTDLTLGIKAGRYLGEDWGGTLSLTKLMTNGVKFEAFATATNVSDVDVLGQPTHIYSGIRIVLPLGNFKYVPNGTEIRTTIAPLGRNEGQSLDSPLPLYDLTYPMSYRAMSQNWNGISE